MIIADIVAFAGNTVVDLDDTTTTPLDQATLAQ